MTMPMEEISGSAMAIRPQINIRMPQMIDHPEAFPRAVAGVFVFIFVSFFSTFFETFLHSDEATAICSQGNKPVGVSRTLAES